jgi:hypothetical protein
MDTQQGHGGNGASAGTFCGHDLDALYLPAEQARDLLSMAARLGACGQSEVMRKEIMTAVQVARDLLEEIRPRQR